jgi:hypothetical protein
MSSLGLRMPKFCDGERGALLPVAHLGESFI